MKLCRWPAAAVCILPSLWAADRPQIPAKLSLKNALDIAYSQSTALRTAQARLQEAEARADQSRAALLPQLNLNAYQAEQTVNLRALGLNVPIIPSKVGPFPSVDARVAATQDIVNIGSWSRRRTASERARTAREQQLNARELVALSVVSAYLQALRSQDTVATLGEQLTLARRLHQLTNDRYTQGVASALDVNRALQQANNLEQSLHEAESTLAAAKLQLSNLMHAQVSLAFELEQVTMSDSSADAQQAVRAAIEARPDYRAAQSQLKAAELQLHAARAARYPGLQFKGDWGISGVTPAENVATYRVQGVLSMPLFTGGRIAAEVAEAQGQLEEARSALDETQSQVETDVLTAIAALESARLQSKVSEENLKLAREELDLATSRYTAGVADNTEVVNAQDRITRAEDSRVRALFNLHVAQANLSRATGSAEKTFRQ